MQGQLDRSLLAALEADAAEGAQLCERCSKWSSDIKVRLSASTACNSRHAREQIRQ